MRPFNTVAEVFAAVQRAKTGAAGYCTNFFPSQSRLEGWIENRELIGQSLGRLEMLFRKDRDFWHLYFCAPDLEVLSRELLSLGELRSLPITADLIGPDASLAELLGIFRNAGFQPRNRLIRLSRLAQVEPPSGEVPVVLAGAPDAPAIIALLENAFDRFVDQLPLPYELAPAIAAGQVLVVKREGELGALLYFETQGLTSLVRYWVVANKFREHRFGSALIRHYFAAHTTVRRFILWVAATNENAVNKYEHYGYKPDGLVDLVLANEMVPS